MSLRQTAHVLLPVSCHAARTMSPFDWTTCPPAPLVQVEHLTTALTDLLAERLLGVYLHGSLAMGSFHPARSDLDLLVVTTQPPTSAQLMRLGQLLLATSLQPHPVELSVVTQEDLMPWQYPTPFVFHYSEDWREATRQGALWSNRPTDPDLAAHVTVIRSRGVCLYGMPVAAVFPEVPRADFLASVLTDVHGALNEIVQTREYAVLNTCRVLAFVHGERVMSKLEGGRWALDTLPAATRGVVQAAVEASVSGTVALFSDEELQTFADWARGVLPALSD